MLVSYILSFYETILFKALVRTPCLYVHIHGQFDDYGQRDEWCRTILA